LIMVVIQLPPSPPRMYPINGMNDTFVSMYDTICAGGGQHYMRAFNNS
jgi:hypothetical protein